MQLSYTMRFVRTAKVLAKCKLNYYRILECLITEHSLPRRCLCLDSKSVSGGREHPRHAVNQQSHEDEPAAGF